MQLHFCLKTNTLYDLNSKKRVTDLRLKSNQFFFLFTPALSKNRKY